MEVITLDNSAKLLWFVSKIVSTPGGALVCQAGYYPRKRTFKTYPKHVFFSYKNRCVFACISLNLSITSFPKLATMTKNTPFFAILHVFAPLNDVGAYIAWSWKSTLIMWIFYEDDIQPEIQVAPRDQHTHTLCFSTRHTCLRKVLRNAHIANQGNTENCCFQRMDVDWQNRK